MHNTSRITSKGQVTIPHDIRTKYGLLPHTAVHFAIQHGKIVLIKEAASTSRNSRGKELIRRMSGKPTLGMTTDEIMRLTRK
jgi:AbrB family looped-hinge helix DNA binding protein